MNEINNLVGLNIDIIETTTGKQFIAIEHWGKHYKGWINEKIVETKAGKIRKKFTTLQLCKFQNCNVCDGAGSTNEIYA
jgi:hypothetical protein